MCEAPFILFNHQCCSCCLQPEHPDSYTIVAMATSATGCLCCPRLQPTTGSSSQRSSPHCRLGRGDLAAAGTTVALVSSLPAILSPGSCLGTEGLFPHLCKVLSFCGSSSPPSFLGKLRLDWARSFSSSPQSSLLFGQSPFLSW